MFNFPFIYAAPSLIRTIFSFIFLLILPFHVDRGSMHGILAAIVTFQIAESFTNAGVEAIITRRSLEAGHISKKYFTYLFLIRSMIGLITYLILSAFQVYLFGFDISYLFLFPAIFINSLFSSSFLISSKENNNMWQSLIAYIILCSLSFFIMEYIKFHPIILYFIICSSGAIIFFQIIFRTINIINIDGISKGEVLLDFFKFFKINFFRIISGSGATYIISIIFSQDLLIYFFYVERVKSMIVSGLSVISTYVNYFVQMGKIKLKVLSDYSWIFIIFGIFVSISVIFAYQHYSNFYLSVETKSALRWIYIYLAIFVFFCPNFIFQYNILPLMRLEDRLVPHLVGQAIFIMFILFVGWVAQSFSVFILGLVIGELYLFFVSFHMISKYKINF